MLQFLHPPRFIATIQEIFPPFCLFASFVLTSITGKSCPNASNRGSNANLIKPICDDDLVTCSLSINGATGKPSSFSMSLYN